MFYIILTLFFCYLILFLISLRIKDNSIVDIFWGFWFILISLILFFKSWNYSIINLIPLILISVWGFRLSGSILLKKIKKPLEDPRYSSWRKSWKYFKIRSFFQVYLLQMILLLIVSFPIFFIFSWDLKIKFVIIWSVISIFWFLYETIADYQLSNYIKNTKEKNMIFTNWLFKYSRHPNYFWEIMFWLGILIISFSNSYYWIIWFITISSLLLFVSWVPMKEERYKRKNNYVEYKNKTSLIIPFIKIKS